MEWNNSLLAGLDTAGVTDSLNQDEFRRLCAEHPDELFEGLYDYLQKLQLQAGMAEERNDDRVVEEQLDQKKSTKLPDRKRFSGGDDPKFASWLIDVENKLEINTDYYPTALACMQYIKSIYTGAIAEHLVPYLQKSSLERYRDASKMIKHLKTIYYNANSITKAKHELHQLYMNDTKFQDFLLYASKDNKKNKSGSDKLKNDKGVAKIPWAEKKQLITEGKCFYYKMPGHIASKCELNKKDTPDLKALEAVKEADTEESSELENNNT
ncbi:hypothetical protein ZTR_08531 [Talaromyces verruculosus]|nr:hypothetical protein ZTR_08531 [Talaromyces verruculosus]